MVTSEMMIDCEMVNDEIVRNIKLLNNFTISSHHLIYHLTISYHHLLGPLFLELGIHPKESMDTSSFMIIFTSISSTFQYIGW